MNLENLHCGLSQRGSWSQKSTWQKFYNNAMVEKGIVFQQVYIIWLNRRTGLNRGKMGSSLVKSDWENSVFDQKRLYDIKLVN